MVFVRLHMTPSPTTFGPGTDAREALARFHRDRIRHAPVVDDGRLVGMVTERDLMRVLPTTIGRLEVETSADPVLVGQAMTPDPIVVGPNDHMDDVARQMREHKISAVPVVQGGSLIGILTSSDLLSAFERILTAQSGTRLCFLRVPGREIDGGFDLVRAAVEAEVRLQTCLRAAYTKGGEIVTLYVEGPERGIEVLRRSSQEAGFVLLERGDLFAKEAG